MWRWGKEGTWSPESIHTQEFSQPKVVGTVNQKAGILSSLWVPGSVSRSSSSETPFISCLEFPSPLRRGKQKPDPAAHLLEGVKGSLPSSYSHEQLELASLGARSRCEEQMWVQAWAEGFEAGSERRKDERGAGLRKSIEERDISQGRGCRSFPTAPAAPEWQVRREPCFPFCPFLLLSFLPVLPALQTLQLVRKWEPELVGPSAWNSFLRVAPCWALVTVLTEPWLLRSLP